MLADKLKILDELKSSVLESLEGKIALVTGAVKVEEKHRFMQLILKYCRIYKQQFLSIDFT